MIADYFAEINIVTYQSVSERQYAEWTKIVKFRQSCSTIFIFYPTLTQKLLNRFSQFLVRDVIYTSHTYATMSVSVCLSVCLSVCDGSALARREGVLQLPPPCLNIGRVTSLRVLGVIVNDKLTAADHAREYAPVIM